MRQVIGHTSRACTYLAVALAVLALTEGCGWKKTMAFAAPSRKAAVEISQTRFANEWGVLVECVTGQQRTELYRRRGGETILYFVHVYWSPDESQVGVLATGAWNFGVAFDRKLGKTIPFEQIRSELGDSIRKRITSQPPKIPLHGLR